MGRMIFGHESMMVDQMHVELSIRVPDPPIP